MFIYGAIDDLYQKIVCFKIEIIFSSIRLNTCMYSTYLCYICSYVYSLHLEWCVDQYSNKYNKQLSN